MANVLKIARSFVVQYYKMMAESPQELHKFYKDQSDFIHPMSISSQDPNINGVNAIREHVSRLNLTNTRVDLTNGNIDAQQSEFDCVIVCVTGHITFPSSPSAQSFVQTFVLAPQQVGGNDTKSLKKSYFVRNSVFRLVNGSSASAAAAPAASRTPVAPPAAAAAAPVLAAQEVVKQRAAPAAVDPSPASVVAPVVSPPPPPAVIADPPAPVVEEVKKEPAPPTKPEGPKTWSQIASSASSDGPEAAPAAATSTGWSVAKSKVASSGSGDKTQGKKSDRNSNKSSDSKNVVPALFVNQLDESVNKDTLNKIFSKYGNISKIDLNQKVNQKGFAFVEYSSVESVNAALAAAGSDDSFVVNGKRMSVEEKSGPKSSSKSASENRATANGASGPKKDMKKQKEGVSGGASQRKK